MNERIRPSRGVPEDRDPTSLRSLLTRHQFTLKKHLGQNFLVDPAVRRRIVDAADIRAEDGVIEIGPGAGSLTRFLAERARRVVTIEKDRQLMPVLADALAGCDNVDQIFADVLETRLADVVQRLGDCARIHVIANLPYYVTTPILFHVIDSSVPFHQMVVMVQKEVADRLAAPPGGKDYGALTVSVQYRAHVSKLLTVGPGAFVPPPNVDSTVVRLLFHTQPPVPVTDERIFFRVIKAAFGVRRKTLLNALSSQLPLDKARCRALLEQAGIDEQRRGETLSLAEFAAIANNFPLPSA